MKSLTLVVLALTFTSCTKIVLRDAPPADSLCTVTEAHEPEGLEYLSCPVDVTSVYNIYCTKDENNEGAYSCMKVYTNTGDARE